MTSSPASSDPSRLYSPMLTVGHMACLLFLARVRGDLVDLRVLVHQHGEERDILVIRDVFVHQLQPTQLKATLENGTFQLVFEARGEEANISIYDITIQEQHCQTPGTYLEIQATKTTTPPPASTTATACVGVSFFQTARAAKLH